MRRLLLSIALLLSPVAFADDTPKTMTRIVVQLDSPDLPKDSFARKPKVMYRAGARYCRIEEAEDTGNKIRGLAIINEPDVWIVNLFDKTAKHIVDTGPTFNCRLPIFSGPVPGTTDHVDYTKLGLEFGHELEFFRELGVQPQPGPVLQTKNTTVYKIQRGETAFALFTYGPEQFPLLVGQTNGGKGMLLWFSGYGHLPFDAKLFAKPDGVTIGEAQH